MKNFLVLLAFIPLFCFGQIFPKSQIKNIILTSSLCFTSGALRGTTETLKWHYPQFKNVCPNANDNICNPSLSWVRKYKNNDPLQGPAFFGSTTFLCWTTDLYHGLEMPHNLLLMSAIVFHLGVKQEWWKYLIEIGVNYLSDQAGFTLTYSIIFRK